MRDGILSRMKTMDLVSVQKAYKRYAKVYNFYFGWIFHPGRQTAVELVDAASGNRILEVGVGTGLSLPLYPRNTKVVGIDISSHMLEKARELVAEEHLDHVEALEVMNAEEMTFPDDSFDSVVAMYVATVVPNRKKFVNEMKRVCKAKGRIVILNHFNSTTGFGARVVSSLGPLSRHLGFRPDLTMEEFLAETGLKVKNKISVNLFGFWDILLVENDKKML
jgi:phosphatidylethanolamine/phosphatidyl-N-methylethanolamine N-methyltransferase